MVLVREGEYAYETATYRRETDYRDGRHPSGVSFATAREDVLRRDFTVNGLLMDPETGETVDYVGGRADLERRLIRTIGDPEERFAEDHLRMLRALRFAAQLDFTVDDGAWRAIKKRAGDITRVSAERILIADRMLTDPDFAGMNCCNHQTPFPAPARNRGVAWGTQPPRFHPEGDVWEHTLRMLALLPGEHLAEEAAARVAWAVLFHDAGKAVTRTESDTGIHFYGHVQRGRELAGEIMKRFKFSREDMEAVLALVGNHMRFMHVREMRPHAEEVSAVTDLISTCFHRLDCLGSHGLLDKPFAAAGRTALTTSTRPGFSPVTTAGPRFPPRAAVPYDPGDDRGRPTGRGDLHRRGGTGSGQKAFFANRCRRRSWMS